MFRRVHVSGGLHVMGCECSVEYMYLVAYMSCLIEYMMCLHVMGCECSVEYMYLVAWLTCHGM